MGKHFLWCLYLIPYIITDLYNWGIYVANIAIGYTKASKTIVLQDKFIHPISSWQAARKDITYLHH